MKPIRFLFLLLLVITGLSSARSCQAKTAEEMLSACRSISSAKVVNGEIEFPHDFESGECWGSFEVLQYVLNTRDATTHKMLYNICLPENGTRTELIAIFVRYLEKHPEEYHLDFTQVATEAIWESFHCKIESTHQK
jgi:hypothetical protein